MTQTADQRPEDRPSGWAAGSDDPAPPYTPPYSSPANPPTAQYPASQYPTAPDPAAQDPAAQDPSQDPATQAPATQAPASQYPTQPVPYPPPAQHPGGDNPFASPASAGGTDVQTGGDGGPGTGGTGRRGGPGWLGAGAIALVAALVASLLSVGLVQWRGGSDASSNASAITGGSSQPQVKAPVTSSGVTNPDWAAVAKAVEPSVVSVQVTGQGGSGEGSGVVLDTAGKVLTNNHVVSAGQNGQIRVVLSDGRSYPARIVGTDPSTDLAVIQVQNAPTGLTPATIGNSDEVAVGDPVMAIGNPLGLSDTVTTGIVSALNRPVTTDASQSNQNPFSGGQSATEQVVTNAIQTDAAVNPGNSGGALVDAQGRVIGITSSIASLGASASGQAGSIGLGFAIPSNEAKDVAAQLVDGGKVQHSYLGVTLSQDTVKVDGAERDAAVIASVSSGAAADKAGLKDGDAVIAVDGEAVNSATSLVAQIRERRAGTKVELSIVRSGTMQKVQVTLGTKPS